MRLKFPTWTTILALLPALLLIAACRSQTSQVFIEVDGGRQSLTTNAATVREALAEADITLESLDRVSPDLYTQMEPGLVIVVTRVEEEIETEREIIPFERQTVTNEALAPGETRLAQLGVNGEDEVSIRVVYEDGQEVNRTEIARTTVIEPTPEILVVGPRGELPSTPVEGTIAYLSNGNAWLMRDSNGSRRALTADGALDGRVFSLSPDGRYLLFTRKITDELDMPLNELGLVSTTIVGEKPFTLDVTGVLNADWSPVASQTLVAYSTAERTASAPGWRANNDLWLLDLSVKKPKPVEIIPPNTRGQYPWWGVTFAWSPDGSRLAYARADQVAVITPTATGPISDAQTVLLDFAPLKTFNEWVWVPGISWSPDGNFIAAASHGSPLASEPAEESPIFDLWLVSVDGRISVKIAEQVGMWANPAWGAAGLAYGQALNPLRSANSRYSIQLTDRDGSNRRQLFPFNDELGLQSPELVWLPGGSSLLFRYNGNLYVVETNGSPPRQLTSDGQATRLSWAAYTPAMTITTTITGVTGVAATTSLTATDSISLTHDPEPTAAGTPTVTAAPAVVATPTAGATPEAMAEPTAVETGAASTNQEENSGENDVE